MQNIVLELTAFVYGGDAIGRLVDGRAAFIPFAMPGEQVRAEVIEEKRGHIRARLVEVLRPSPLRISPRCAHFGKCGGCHYQHLAYEHQVNVKTAILREQFQRIAGIKDPPICAMIPSSLPWHYRNAVQFHLDPGGHVGYQRSTSHEVIPIQECFLPEGALNDLWPRLSFEPESGIERVELRLGSEDDLMVVLESRDPQPPEFEVDLPISAVHLSPAGSLVLAGDDHITIEILGRPFRVSAGAFFQVNTAQAENMVRCLLESLTQASGQTVFDIYSGVGLFSAFLAPIASRLVSIELSPEACQDFAANLDDFDNVELYQGAAEEVLPALDIQPATVVVDPPRGGLEHAVLETLVRLAPPHIAYISCDPATLARDSRRLIQQGYTLRQVTPFDLFPQTYAIESLNLFDLE